MQPGPWKYITRFLIQPISSTCARFEAVRIKAVGGGTKRITGNPETDPLPPGWYWFMNRYRQAAFLDTPRIPMLNCSF